MKLPSSHLRRQERPRLQSGVALILVLALVAILSTLVLAYLLHSQLEGEVSAASAGQARADLLARGAVDAVTGEFRQEIAAGSTIYSPSGSDVRDPNCLFLPMTNFTAVPHRIDSGAPANVLKRSAYGSPFYSGLGYDTTDWPAPNYAAQVSTTNASDNGRSISLSRWNLPQLLPKADATSTNLAPVATFLPPDWIYLDRTASPVTTWNANLIPDIVAGSINTSRVVSRYAYVVYDEGGLLDVNAAGHPSSVTPTMVRQKISEACADLTQIGLSSSDVDALVAWRNPVNGTSATAYTNYVYSPLTNAFLTPASGERLFTSRQQLINFLTQNVAATPSDIIREQNALPYLTHFSREQNSPSTYPLYDASSWGGSGSYAYATTRTNSTATNIFIASARATASFTNSSGLAIQPNEPITFSRFPLSRLAWLGPNGPNGATAAQIQQSFGLVWDASFAAWKYVGASGSTILNSVSTLHQVIAANREPNFFELLKAGILSGSTPSDLHLMQIGLGVIDQSNSNPLPTRIEFAANTGVSALYGTKNLPYLSTLAFSPYRSSTSLIDAWLEPIFWNPYVTAATSSSPLNLQVTVTQGVMDFGAAYYDAGQGQYMSTFSPDQPATGTIPTIQISASNGGSLVATTSTPTFLNSLLTNSICTVTLPPSYQATYTATGITYTYAGFWLGEATAPNSPNTYDHAYTRFKTDLNSQSPQFIVTADYGGSAGPQEIQRMSLGAQTAIWCPDPTCFITVGQHFAYIGPLDPRTGRFGLNAENNPVTPSVNNWTTFWSPTQNDNGAGICFPYSNPASKGSLTFNYGAPSLWYNPGNWYRFADNSSTAAGLPDPFYKDSDGAQRRGDAWWSSMTANTLPMRGDTLAYRPVLLDRNLYSVGELGYAFRDLPWRSLDLCNTNSADAGLIDLFCVNDGYAGSTSAPMVAGRVNLNTRNAPVLAALLSGATRSELNSSYDINSTDATNIASSITTLTGTTPLLNKSEIATRLAPIDPTVTASNNDSNIKERREALVRALAEAGQVRTWNLMIDVVAQEGHFPPGATSLGNFVVDAERRYWAHVALDRYSGQVIDMQLEPVNQ